jgi:hypothetical protein
VEANPPPSGVPLHSGVGLRSGVGLGRPLGVVLVALLLVVSSGCSLIPRGERPPPGTRSQNEPVMLEVTNQNFQDARIYAIWDGFRERAGLVNGNTTQTLRLQSRDGQLRVEVDFVAGGGYVTDPIQVWRGETIRLIIPPGY